MPLLGVDIGGTFTDFVLVDDRDQVRLHKRLTTPDDPARSFVDGMRELGLAESAVIVHGSTIATNALLERRGARTALITTAGFADVIEIGRQNRPDLYALVPGRPAPLVPREWRFEVRERVSAQGEVLQPLDPAAVAPLAARLREQRIESVAVCLLFSFLRPEHERRVREALNAAAEPRPSISLSSDILPEYREYERASTTVLNAYVAPLMDRYLGRLEAAVAPRALRVMQSNGGSITARTARAQAARTALSGPAGGVVGAFACATAESRDTSSGVITFDMGGTSTDVCLCPGQIPFTAEGEIAGMPLRLPIIDIHTVGAGGGSLARVDAGGALIVGPESAGAEPGPVCYGRGGRVPTVTDANLTLRRLDPAHFLGGRMPLDVSAARASLEELARQLELPSAEAAAWGILQVANAAMDRAIRRISIERGHDPRDFTLVAFGGAGPLHACELAERLSLRRVLVPRAPGVLSAFGMLLADLVRDYSQSILRRAEGMGAAALDGLFAPLEARARDEMAAEGVARPRLERTADLRYAGQSFEINVAAADPARLTAEFHAHHARRYGHAHPEAPVEIVTLRVRAVGETAAPKFADIPAGDADPRAAQVGEAPAWFEGPAGAGPMPTRLFDRGLLRAGNLITGPAVVFQLDATTVIPPGWTALKDRAGSLVLAC